jgi:hypothetical protein
MTTPTTDADPDFLLLHAVYDVMDQWAVEEPGNRLTDAEALAKVRALVLGDRDESKPPPDRIGDWKRRADEEGDTVYHSRKENTAVFIGRAHEEPCLVVWGLDDDEEPETDQRIPVKVLHALLAGYAPQGAPPDGSKP